jgi:L-lactate utilization protein LutB
MEERIEKTIKALNRHGFKAEFIASKDQAAKLILERIPREATVGIPGSRTVRELGLDRALRERGNVTYDHWLKGLSKEDILKMRKAQLTCEVLLTSANAVTETGEILNMDGVGNRIAPTIFGPQKVIFAVGINKLAPDLAAARMRVMNIAAPRRASELDLEVPCVKTGECNDCNSPDRVCRAELVLHRAPSLTEIEVYIVGEDLGN